MTDLETMTQTKWDRMPESVRATIRDLSGLNPHLVGLEGCRVEVTFRDGTKERFNVGVTTGWKPAHIALRNRASSGGFIAPGADRIASVRVVDGRERRSPPKGLNRPAPLHSHGCY